MFPYTGRAGPKDTFASVIPKGYDLRAPDYSYLMITELKSFYYQKYTIFTKCRQIASEISRRLHAFYVAVQEHVSTICTYIQSLQAGISSDLLSHLHGFSQDLTTNVLPTSKAVHDIGEIIDRTNQPTPTPLNLAGFADGPPASEVQINSSLALPFILFLCRSS